MANFCAFGLTPNRNRNFLRKFWNLPIKISMENWLFIHFLSLLPGPLPFYTALENNTIFLQQFFRFRGREASPSSSLRAPMPIRNSLEMTMACIKYQSFTQNFKLWKFLKLWKKLESYVIAIFVKRTLFSNKFWDCFKIYLLKIILELCTGMEFMTENSLFWKKTFMTEWQNVSRENQL